MNRHEEKLFLYLCDLLHAREGYSAEFVRENASAGVLGQLFMNRMAGIAYRNLKERGLLSAVNREFRNSLCAASLQNTEKNKSYLHCVSQLTEILRGAGRSYAMLKGALLCAMYPDGCRTANDIDLLVRPADVTKIGHVLLKNGFRQGDIRDGRFVPASREQIISSRMLRGETVPYIAEVNLPQMKYLEVDVNFSLDYKNSDDTCLGAMLTRATDVKVGENTVHTLALTDFFLHLCLHLYKEATTYPWVEMGRDMTLYKFSDISLMSGQMIASDVDRLLERAEKYGLMREVVYAVLVSDALLPMENRELVRRAEEAEKKLPGVLREVINPADGTLLFYPDDRVKRRFFVRNRAALLKKGATMETAAVSDRASDHMIRKKKAR